MDLFVKRVDRCLAEHCVHTAAWLHTQETGQRILRVTLEYKIL